MFNLFQRDQQLDSNHHAGSNWTISFYSIVVAWCDLAIFPTFHPWVRTNPFDWAIFPSFGHSFCAFSCICLSLLSLFDCSLIHLCRRTSRLSMPSSWLRSLMYRIARIRSAQDRRKSPLFNWWSCWRIILLFLSLCRLLLIVVIVQKFTGISLDTETFYWDVFELVWLVSMSESVNCDSRYKYRRVCVCDELLCIPFTHSQAVWWVVRVCVWFPASCVQRSNVLWPRCTPTACVWGMWCRRGLQESFFYHNICWTYGSRCAALRGWRG
jgi:hypothetical protein